MFRHVGMLLLAAVVLGACGGPEAAVDDAGREPGDAATIPDAGSVDAAMPGPDAGPPDADAGGLDAGEFPSDAGPFEPDAGTEPDAGLPAPDGGLAEPDAGTEPDAGLPPPDGGLAEPDAGADPVDAGPSDAGPANHEPALTVVFPSRVDEDVPLEILIDATDLDGDVLELEVTGLPPWLVFDADASLLHGTPSNADVGPVSGITLVATDGNGGRTTKGPYSFDVANVNDAPRLENLPPSRLEAGVAFSWTPVVVDDDAIHGDVLVFNLVGTRPAWLSFDADDGRLAGMPGAELVGTQVGPFTLSVMDSATDSASVGPFSMALSRDNTAPRLDGEFPPSWREDEPFAFRPQATDPDALAFGDTLSFRVENKPSWAVFDVATGVLSGTPKNANVGVYAAIRLVVADSYGAEAALGPFRLEVLDVNDNPHLGGAPTQQATEGGVWRFAPIATDEDSPAAGFTFSATGLPAWMTVDASYGALSGTPGPTDGGRSHALTISVSDGEGGSASLAFTLDVLAVNDLPVFATATSASLAQGAELSLPVRFDDPDGTTAPVIEVTAQPAWLTFSNGTLRGTPANADVGLTIVTLVAIDDGGAHAQASVRITVTNVNDPPTITQPPAPRLVVATPYRHDFGVTDPDAMHGDAVTCRISGTPPAWITLDATTCVLEATAPASAAGSTFGPYTLTATDGDVSATLAFSFAIISNNTPPQISGTPATRVDEDAAYAFTPQASDAQDTALRFTAKNLPAWASLDTNTGALTGTPRDADVRRWDAITLTVADQAGATTSLAAFAIDVTNTNDAPTLTGLPVAEIDEATPFLFAPVPADDDLDSGDVLRFTGTNLPAFLALDANTGRLSGTPAKGTVGTFENYAITVRDAAGATSALGPFTLVVRNVNDAPVLTGTPSAQATEDVAYAFTPLLSDPDAGDAHAFSFTNLPAWLAGDTTTGKITGTPGDDAIGTHAGIRITVRDAAGATSLLGPFTVTVANVNDVPTLEGSPAEQASEDSSYSFTPLVTDADRNDTRLFTISKTPAWASFSSTTGTLAGLPGNAHVGTTSGLVITVTDGAGAQASLGPFSIEVRNLNDPPTITGTPATTVDEDVGYSFSPFGHDVDAGATITFAIVNKPVWATFDTTSGRLTGTPGNGDVGTTTAIAISVSDGLAAPVSLDPFDLQVRNVNDAPQISGSPATTAPVSNAYAFTPSASDIDPSADVLLFAIVNKPAWATFDTATGKLSGTPSAAQAGTTTGIVISVTDGHGGSAQLAAFSLTVIAAEPPVLAEPVRYLDVNEDSALTIILNGATDPDGNSATLVVSEVPFAPGSGTLLLPNGGALPLPLIINSQVRYRPAANFFGLDSFTVRWRDESGLTVEQGFEILVNPMNDAPVAEALSATVVEDTPTDLVLRATDIDRTTPKISAIITFPQHGTLYDGAVAIGAFWSGRPAPATVRYVPAKDYNGPDLVDFRACDADSACVMETVTITVTPVNDPPILTNPPPRLWGEAGLLFAWQPVVVDPDGPSLTFSLASGSSALPTGFTLSSSTGALKRTLPWDTATGLLATGLKIQVTDGIATAVSSAFAISVSKWSRPGGPLFLPAGDQIVDLATADVDGDGLLDLVGVEDYTHVTGDILVWRQETLRPGLFREPLRLATPDGARALTVAVANMNADIVPGKTMLDLVVGLKDGRVAIYLQRNAIAFGFASPVVVPFGGNNAGEAAILVGPNLAGNGTDTTPDIIVTDTVGYHFIDCNRPTIGAFECTVVPDSLFGVVGQQLATGDLDGDGRLDVVTNQYEPTLGTQWARRVLGRGGLEWSPVSSVATSGRIVVKNANGTEGGKTYDDVFILGASAPKYYRSNASGQLTLGSTGSFNAIPHPVGEVWSTDDAAVADVTGDGILDAIMPLKGANGIGVIPGQLTVSGTTVAYSFKTTGQLFFPTPANPSQIEVADLNADGFMDVVVSFFLDRSSMSDQAAPKGVTVYFGSAAGWTANPSEAFGAPVRAYTAQVGHHTVRIADLKKSDTLTPDLLLCGGARTVAATTGVATIGFQQPNTAPKKKGWYDLGTTGAFTDLALGTRPAQDCRAADFNGDGRPDLVTSHLLTGSETGPALQVFLSTGTAATFGAAAKFGTGQVRARSIFVGDVTGDGAVDLAVLVQTTGATGTPALILRNNGSGAFTTLTSPGTGSTIFDYRPWFGSVTGGALPDALFVSQSGHVTVYPQTAVGTWGPAIGSGATGLVSDWFTVDDVNLDGTPDLVGTAPTEGVATTYRSGRVQVALGDPALAGAFLPVSYELEGPFFGGTEAEYVDLNGDGREDLVVPDTLGVITVFLADGANPGRFRAPVGFSATYSDLRSVGVGVGDVDGDGVKDLVFANESEAHVVEFLSTLAK